VWHVSGSLQTAGKQQESARNTSANGVSQLNAASYKVLIVLGQRRERVPIL